jgi:hypothetical protein
MRLRKYTRPEEGISKHTLGFTFVRGKGWMKKEANAEKGHLSDKVWGSYPNFNQCSPQQWSPHPVVSAIVLMISLWSTGLILSRTILI